MFTDIVIGIDERGRALDAAPLVGVVGRAAACTLVHVCTPGLDAAVDAHASAASEQLLLDERATSGLVQADLRTVVALTAAEGLHRAARDADLLIIGAPRHTPDSPRTIRQGLRDVFQAAPCPILVAPPRFATGDGWPAVIGVGFDDSADGLRAIDLATDLATHLSARLDVCRVIAPAASSSLIGEDAEQYLEALAELERDRVEALLSPTGVASSVQVIAGDPHTELRRFAAHVDLMVWGTRAWDPIARAAFGSAADELVRDLRTPLLLVPRAIPRRATGRSSEARTHQPAPPAGTEANTT